MHLAGNHRLAHGGLGGDRVGHLGGERKLRLVIKLVVASRRVGVGRKRRVGVHVVERHAHEVDEVSRDNATGAHALHGRIGRASLDAQGRREHERQVGRTNLVSAEVAHLLGKKASHNAGKHVARTCRTQGRGAGLGDERGLNARHTARGGLCNDGKVGRSHRPGKALGGIHQVGQTADGARLLAEQARQLAGMGREHERGLTAQRVGMRVGVAQADAGSDVERVGVEHEGCRRCDEGAYDLTGTKRGAHAGTCENAVNLGSKARQLLCSRSLKRAVLRGRQTYHRDAEEMRLCDGHHGRGNSKRHVTGAAASRGLGRHDGRAGEPRRASHDKDAAVAVLVGKLVTLRQGVEVVGLAKQVGARGVGKLLGTFVVGHKARHHKLAGRLLTETSDETGLEREHGERRVSLEEGAFRLARRGVDAAGNVHREHHALEIVVDNLGPHVERLGHHALETRAEHRVDNDVGLYQQGRKLLVVGSHMDGNTDGAGALGCLARRSAADERGFGSSDDVDLEAVSGQVVSRHPAVAAIVAWAAEHDNSALVDLAHGLLGNDRTRSAHELASIDAALLNGSLEPGYIAHVQNRLHCITLILVCRARPKVNEPA